HKIFQTEIGRDVVSVAASSGSVERAFSVASDILTAKRAAMKPDLFVNLMLIKCNAGLKIISCILEFFFELLFKKKK
ncbi:hypothetical protein DAPPUDRAFT_272836, partial [Daphnia pulex]